MKYNYLSGIYPKAYSNVIKYIIYSNTGIHFNTMVATGRSTLYMF